jgi:cell division protein FtsB
MSSTAPALRARVPRLAGAALERARLTVVPRQRRRSNPLAFLLLVSMIAVGGIVGLLLFNTSMQQASFAATSLQSQADQLVAQQQSLQTQLDHLRDPQVVAQKAQRMGMVLPTSPAVLDLKTGKVLGTPTPATTLDRLQLHAPPPVKPAEINPRAHVTVIHPPARHGQHKVDHAHSGVAADGTVHHLNTVRSPHSGQH